MKESLLLLLLVFFDFVCCELVVIDCTFPCINPNEICQVNDETIQCIKKTNNTKWVLQSSTTLPVYQLAEIGLGQTCEIAPQHPTSRLSTNINTKNKTETVIDWPIPGYDSYYSNCATHLYCDRANVCVKQIEHGQVCESSHQCLNGECINNTCTLTSSSSPSSTNSSDSSDNSSSAGFTTVHIIIVVIGTILFIAVIIGLFLYHRRRKRGDEEQNKERKILAEQHISTSSSNSLPTVINILDAHYETTTPTIQQQQLQFQLQRQLNNQEVKSPPPYSP